MLDEEKYKVVPSFTNSNDTIISCNGFIGKYISDTKMLHYHIENKSKNFECMIFENLKQALEFIQSITQ